MTWCMPNVTLKWGAYFSPDTDDDAKLVDSAIKAHDAGLVTLRAAVQKIQRTFNVENVDQFLESLEEEAAAKQEKLANDMHAMASIGLDPAGKPPKPGMPSKKPTVAAKKPDVPK